MVHHVLPCEEEVNKKIGNIAAACHFDCEGNPVADLKHCFFFWHLMARFVSWILDLVGQADPTANYDSILCLEFLGND